MKKSWKVSYWIMAFLLSVFKVITMKSYSSSLFSYVVLKPQKQPLFFDQHNIVVFVSTAWEDIPYMNDMIL